MEIRKIKIEEILYSPDGREMFLNYALDSKNSLTPDVNLDNDMYVKFEEVGALDCVGAYDGDKLVGFITGITSIIPHYSKPATTIESFYVVKQYRKGGTGKKLLEELTEFAKQRGSTNIFMTALIGSDLEKVAPYYGFTPTNIAYTKKL